MSTNTDLNEMSKEQLMQLRDEIKDRQQIESHINDPEFLDYRQQINSVLDASSIVRNMLVHNLLFIRIKNNKIGVIILFNLLWKAKRRKLY